MDETLRSEPGVFWKRNQMVPEIQARLPLLVSQHMALTVRSPWAETSPFK